MTLQELLEAAQLDALGLLDDDDRMAFDAAFAAANASVRLQVRAEQARWAKSAPGLPNAEVPSYMKGRVLGAIRSEIAKKAAGTLAGVGADTGESSDDQFEASLANDLGSGAPVIGRVDGSRKSAGVALGVAPAWRASSLGFATAAAVLLAAFFSVTRQMETLKDKANDDRVLEAMSKGYGGEFYVEAIFGKQVERFTFAAAPSVTTEAAATIYLLPENKKARLFVKDLAVGVGQTARVVLVDENNQITSQVAEFAMNEKIGTANLELEASKGVRLAIAVANVGQAATTADIKLVVRTA